MTIAVLHGMYMYILHVHVGVYYIIYDCTSLQTCYLVQHMYTSCQDLGVHHLVPLASMLPCTTLLLVHEMATFPLPPSPVPNW